MNEGFFDSVDGHPILRVLTVNDIIIMYQILAFKLGTYILRHPVSDKVILLIHDDCDEHKFVDFWGRFLYIYHIS